MFHRDIFRNLRNRISCRYLPEKWRVFLLLLGTVFLLQVIFSKQVGTEIKRRMSEGNLQVIEVSEMPDMPRLAPTGGYDGVNESDRKGGFEYLENKGYLLGNFKTDDDSWSRSTKVEETNGKQSHDDMQGEKKPNISLAREINLRPMPNRHVTKVIVNAYYRGGSSMLGKIIKFHPASFYLFEPYTGLYFDYKRSHHYTGDGDIFVDPSTGQYRKMDSTFENVVVQAALDILECRMHQLPPIILRHSFLTTSIRSYGGCLKSERPRSDQELARSRCVLELNRLCLSSQIRSFKTIRLPMDLLLRVIEKDPSIKVIYSTRDPRGMLNSRKSMEKIPPALFPTRLDDLCVHVEHDYRLFLDKQHILNGTFYVLNYDSLTSDTLNTAKSIYDWLRIPLPDSTVAALKKLIRQPKGGKPPPKWKTGLSETEINMFYQKCSYLMKVLGYDKFEGS